ncbi:mandelate racemase/muconate lactonizing enzyme family protein [Wenyingzhuangia sp. 2_MG-2023]|uniref:mandelate racemase/muconate lactonizing enzyme family protein n=1 Tax=Wenyingzhuangia sp. 2_MG-2023 TaxID=3062639 RepID=UPI0026E3D3FB|nr:mandelate racemase/muconate lactonizing enzyme family protein [Wenyingzhuangia sp. 2_MG-2023]MDO6738670.1 mandelate racemase/muconate lactonizing enzyme family protein [Wenyingzhuangia sp. 2_MG-2023]MDO6803549.1 mandelate racemase/muconate lactonizing enzyme family protein [Wenyingzhuangia sp. 1_MG-2023]
MMRIKEIKPYVLTSKLDEPFYFSQWQYDTRKICLVKITLEDGTYGWGEGYGPADVIKAGIEYFTPFIIGRSALEHETIWQEMYLRSLDFGRSGIFQAAVSAIDVALWDLKGKILNQPVSVLLGGVKNPEIHPYATGLYFERVDDLEKKLVDEALEYKKEGFKAIKMKVGLGIELDTQYVKAVRNAIGDDIKLMIDANHAYSYKEALELALKVEKYSISWFEEPVSPEDYDGYKKLRLRTSIPIAGGECEYLKHGFKRLFDNDSVDIAQPDICATGGLTEAKRIASLAQIYSKDVVPHTWGTWIAISAAVHFVANLDKNPGRMYSDKPVMELDRTENPLRDEVVRHSIVIKNGVLTVPKTPGLGVDINEEALLKYSCDNVKHFIK